MSEYFPEAILSGARVKVEFDLPNCAKSKSKKCRC